MRARPASIATRTGGTHMGRQAHAFLQQCLGRVDTKCGRCHGHATSATARGGGHDERRAQKVRADGGTYRPSGDGQGRGHFGRRAQRMRADDGTYIGRQTSTVEFEARSTRKRGDKRFRLCGCMGNSLKQNTIHFLCTQVQRLKNLEDMNKSWIILPVHC